MKRNKKDSKMNSKRNAKNKVTTTSSKSNISKSCDTDIDCN